MKREIGEKFTDKGKTYIVRVNGCDVHGWVLRGSVECNSRCAFWNGAACQGVLSITGDCQFNFRGDGYSVFFEDAALARSPLGAAAAKSAKN